MARLAEAQVPSVPEQVDLRLWEGEAGGVAQDGAALPTLALAARTDV